jgi:hypothetical protein
MSTEHVRTNSSLVSSDPTIITFDPSDYPKGLQVCNVLIRLARDN